MGSTLRVVRRRYNKYVEVTQMGIYQDIRTIKERDPAATNALEILLTYPGLHALLLHRFAHRLYNMHVPILPRLVSHISRGITGIEIHPGAKIGKRFFIDHGMGVIIGETAEIGDDVTLYQGVTLGGTGKQKGKRHPTVGNGVMVGVGAKVLGSVTIGDHANIGAGAVVLRDVPSNATAVGVPARSVVYRESSQGDGMRVQHLPDPEAEMICALHRKINELERRLSILEESDPERVVMRPLVGAVSGDGGRNGS
jgi:serine O-acetyltransferase